MLQFKDNKNLVLGSQSPRRQALLKSLNLDFKIIVPQVNEIYPKDLLPESVPEFLSELKFNVLKTHLKDNEIGITSDTIVIINGTILEKPQSEAQAIKMLKTLSGNTHKVVSGVTLGSTQKKISFSQTTLVKFNELSNHEIEYYVKKYQPYDKAGSYGVQEWIGYVGVSEITGCYYNVMGLPIGTVYAKLKQHFGLWVEPSAL
jgi:septum formation protein